MVSLIKADKVYFTGYLCFLIIGICCLIFLDTADLLLYFSANRIPFFDVFFKYFTRVGEEFMFAACCLLLLFYKVKESIIMGATGILTLLVILAMKFAFGHPRPTLFLQDLGRFEEFNPILGVQLIEGYSSFPSGHTAAGFALMTLLALLFKNKWIDILLLIMAAFVGISRIYLGQHFVKDVFLGSIVGVLMALVMVYFCQKIAWPEWTENTITKRIKRA